LQCPLTVDYGGFLLSLKELNTSIIPLGGTSVSAAIKVAMQSFEAGTEEERVLIIITDGEENASKEFVDAATILLPFSSSKEPLFQEPTPCCNHFGKFS
jgi:uncharacterized protein with von Willebrand factor type A (vWA) domain